MEYQIKTIVMKRLVISMKGALWSNLVVLLAMLFTSCDKIEAEGPQYGSSYVIQENGDSLFCTFQEYMSLQPVAKVQGGACYGDYFIQGYETNEFITIYNLKTKSYVTTLYIPAPPPSSKTHSNTLNFGVQKYDENDDFPLLYISSGYRTNNISYIYVYRIFKNSKEDSDFSVSLVQTISLCGFNSWTEGIIDVENNFLWIKYEPQGVYGYAKYALPSIESSQVSINYEDYLQDFRLERQPNGSNQGHLFDNNRILLVSGVPSGGHTLAFISINTITQQRELILDLTKVGLHNNNENDYLEPESLIFYNNQLMICYRYVIYILNIQRVKNGVKTNYFS